MAPKNVQVFVSLSRQDKETGKRFDAIASKENVTVLKQEYEAQNAPPAWQTVRDTLSVSKALFLLVGPKLVEVKKGRRRMEPNSKLDVVRVGGCCLPEP